MKTRYAVPVVAAVSRLFAALVLAGAPLLHAQLVADGGSLNFTGATNLSGDLVVGTNGGNTLLTILAPGTVTNANGTIGLNATSTNNQVHVENSGAVWHNNSDLHVGYSSSGNQLVVSNGGLVVNTLGFIGDQSDATNNVAVVTGADSRWIASSYLRVGYFGTGNQLVVSNGGTVISGDGFVGSDNAYSGVPNVAVVTGAGSLWTNSGNLYLSYAGSGNQLMVSDGGMVANADGGLGINSNSSNNLAVVTGTGSLWTNSGFLVIGYASSENQLVVSNGAVLTSTGSALGYFPNANNNLVLVTGPSSQWRNNGALTVGYDDNTNSQVVIRDGGLLVSSSGGIGSYSPSANRHSVLVADPGSLWSNSNEIRVGDTGSGNQLAVTNSGTVIATNVTVGFNVSSINNRVTVDGGNLIVTNSGGTAALDIRRGTNVLNAGLIVADNLLLTNSAGFFDFNGGTLITRGTTVNNGLPFDVGNGPPAATYQLIGNGLHTFNNGLVISAAATLTGYGIVAGPLTVQSGGNLSPSAPLGLLVLSNSPVLQGSVLMQISKKGINRTNNQIQVAAPLTYGGNLIVSGLGLDELTVGDSFNLFSAGSYGGAFTSVSLPALNPGLKWDNKLLIDGSIAVVEQVPTISGVVKSGTNLVFDVSEGSPGGAYTLLTTTNVTLPLSAWATNSTGFFDALGGITIIRGINPDETQRYFSVRVP